MISIASVCSDPTIVTRDVLHGKCTYLLRLLTPRDAEVFAAYLEGLGEETQMFFGPHPLNAQAAVDVCEHLNPEDVMRFGLFETENVMVGYFLLVPGVRKSEIGRYAEKQISLTSDSDCTFAPSLADSCQSKGLGSGVIRRIFEIAVSIGCKRAVLSGGVQERNRRGVTFYTKNGFRKIGEFRTKTKDGTEINNLDMICILDEAMK